MLLRKFLLLFFIFSFFTHPAHALSEASFEMLQKNMAELQKTVHSLQETVASQDEVIKQQNLKIQALQEEPGSTAGVSSGTVLTTQGPQASGPLKVMGLSQGLNPEIGATATVLGHLTEATADEETNDTISLQEMELSLAQYVDPYSRLDAIIAFNDQIEEQNVNIEEAYYSHWGLPFGFRTQLGKFRAKIGKQNLQHLHALETADYALVIKDFFGDEGLASSGIRLVNDIPNPWDIPFEISGEVLRGNNGNSFSGISRRPIFNAHAKTFFQTSEDSNLELGWTTMFGDENPAIYREAIDENDEITIEEVIKEQGQDRYGPKLFGADITWNWNLPEGKKFKWQNETYFQRRGTTRHANGHPWGFYSLLDYRFHPKFSSGLRLDYLKPLDVLDQHEVTYGISPYLTFWQSEFANFQIQYSHTTPASADARENNEIFLRVNALIGAHRHPVQ